MLFYFPDLCKATSVNTEQLEHLNYVPLFNVSFPEATEKLISFRDSVAGEQTQNLKYVQGLSTALQTADSPDRSEGVNLIMGSGCDIQKKNANCGSNGLKPVIINDNGGCISIRSCATKDLDSLKKQQRRFSDIANNTITAECFSLTTKIDDNQYNGTCGNVNTSTFNAQYLIQPESLSEKIVDALHKTRHEPGVKYCSLCNLSLITFGISVVRMQNLSEDADTK